MKNSDKIISSFAGVALLVTVIMVIVISFKVFSQMEKASVDRNHTYAVIKGADELLSELRDAETGQRGYSLTGNEAFLEPYLSVRDNIYLHLKQLRQITRISSSGKDLDALAQLMDAKLEAMAHVIELRRNNDMTAVVAAVSSGKGKRLMDSIREKMKNFILVEEGLLAQHDSEFKSNVHHLFLTIITASLLTLLLAVLLICLIYRETQQRVKKAVHLETEYQLRMQEEINRQLHQANVTLQISEAKWAVTLNSIGDAVMATDNQGNVTFLNPVAEQLTGWPCAEAVGHPADRIVCLISEETRQPADLPIKNTLEHGTIQTLANHIILISRNGSECAIADSCAPIRNNEGQVAGSVMVFRDISGRRNIEIMLEKAHKELEVIKKAADEVSEFAESIINTVREPLISLDQDLRVVSVSRSFYEVFKVNPEETVGQLIYDLGNKQWDIPRLRELLENILPKKATFDNYEVEHDFSTIGRRTMLLNARQIQRASGKERIILLAIEDITERKEIEAGLEKTRKELEVIKKTADEVSEFAESIINTVREPLISLDQDLRVVRVSRSFYEVFKVNPEETVGQLIYDLGNKQWDIPRLRELLETILPQKATFDNYEVEHDFSTIGRRIMLLNARQIHRVLGKERIILLAIEDITERKEIANGLEQAHEELNALATELKRVAQVKSEFLANMSHELRTPLNSINGFSEVLYDETFGPLNEKQKKYVNNVLTSGKHLLLLINQILDMAKVEAGKMKLSLSVISMKNLLNEISLLVADLISKKHLEMSLEIAEDMPDIEADELKVKEVIYNLLSNAVKFTPEGGRINMRAKQIDSYIEVVVTDTGIGIASENMEKIFEGFFRVDTPYSRVTEGTGLGLPLSKNLVELHGGTLSVESDGLNKGISVRFTLPVIAKEGI